MNHVALIDIGNTHTHYGLWANGQIGQTGKIATSSWFQQPKLLDALLHKLGASDIAYCSVVPKVCATLEQVAQQRKLKTYHLRYNTCPSLPIHYPKPEEIGEDRLANAVCAQAFYGTPAIVIDMGTAVTFDIVGEDGGYLGGIIAPGVSLMTHYLHEQTALLPLLSEEEWGIGSGIGKSTREAMRIGCVIGFSGMIKALLEVVLKELGSAKEPAIVGTGGTAHCLLKDVHPRLIIDEDVTLKGLAQAWERHGKTR